MPVSLREATGVRILAVAPGASYSTLDLFNGIVPELRKLGVEVHEYDLEARLEISGRFLNMVWQRNVRNAAPEDKASAKLNKYTDADKVYKASIEVLERALRFEVDGVLIFSGMFCHPNAFVLLRRAHIRTALLLSESPYDDYEQMKILPLVDVAWTNERSSVKTLRAANPNVNYMPHAYNPEIHYPRGGGPHRPGTGHDLTGADEDAIPAHDVVFVGSMFAERADLLSQIDWSGIDFGLYGDWRGLPPTHKLRKHLVSGVVDNRDAAALYRKAKIGLNLYRESMGWGRLAPRITHAESMNPRTLELAACGTFQVSQHRSEIAETFNGWIPTFKDATGLQALLGVYLSDDAMRQRAAASALQAVQPHTFSARARTIVDDLARAEWPVKQMVAV
jgi:spore maturation protein CgeB